MAESHCNHLFYTIHSFLPKPWTSTEVSSPATVAWNTESPENVFIITVKESSKQTTPGVLVTGNVQVILRVEADIGIRLRFLTGLGDSGVCVDVVYMVVLRNL